MSGAEPVGSAAEEAAKLFAAVSEWAAQAAGAIDEHLATGSEECRVCPVCQAVSLLRRRDPEVVEHLTQAAGSLLAAFKAAVTPEPGPRPPVQRIDIG